MKWPSPLLPYIATVWCSSSSSRNRIVFLALSTFLICHIMRSPFPLLYRLFIYSYHTIPCDSVSSYRVAPFLHISLFSTYYYPASLHISHCTSSPLLSSHLVFLSSIPHSPFQTPVRSSNGDDPYTLQESHSLLFTHVSCRERPRLSHVRGMLSKTRESEINI